MTKIKKQIVTEKISTTFLYDIDGLKLSEVMEHVSSLIEQWGEDARLTEDGDGWDDCWNIERQIEETDQEAEKRIKDAQRKRESRKMQKERTCPINEKIWRKCNMKAYCVISHYENMNCSVFLDEEKAIDHFRELVLTDIRDSDIEGFDIDSDFEDNGVWYSVDSSYFNEYPQSYDIVLQSVTVDE